MSDFETNLEAVQFNPFDSVKHLTFDMGGDIG
jgi:hypothetical protein